MGIAREIRFEDIRKGDLIRVVDVRTVTALEDANVDGRFEIDGPQPWLIRRESSLHLGERTFGLVERPLPPLPTEVGSVVRVESDQSDVGATPVGIWLLTQDRIWVSSGGMRGSTTEFIRFLERGKEMNRRFTVIN